MAFSREATLPNKQHPTLRGHLAIARPDHWFKNAFVLPGVAIALYLNPDVSRLDVAIRALVGLVAICVTASSYYTLNELLDAKHDALHPTKRHRPVPTGRVHVPLGYLQWLVLAAASFALAAFVNRSYCLTLVALWGVGVLYNVRPIRLKDTAYLDVLSEALNNPLRMLGGWYIVTEQALPPGSLLLSYWMVGGYFMALKRYAELRSIGDVAVATAYRKSFSRYSAERLLTFATFSVALSMLCFGVFVVRYRLELVLAFPPIALVVAEYLRLALTDRSPVQTPESLYREPRLMLWVVIGTGAVVLLLSWDIPALYDWLRPLVRAPGQPG